MWKFDVWMFVTLFADQCCKPSTSGELPTEDCCRGECQVTPNNIAFAHIFRKSSWLTCFGHPSLMSQQEGEGGCKNDTDCAAGLSCTAGLEVFVFVFVFLVWLDSLVQQVLLSWSISLSFNVFVHLAGYSHCCQQCNWIIGCSWGVGLCCSCAVFGGNLFSSSKAEHEIQQIQC